MKTLILLLTLFYFISGNAQDTKTIHVQDAVHNTGFDMDFYLSEVDPGNSKILFTVYKNGKPICTDGNVKIWVDFQERHSNGKRETFESFNQEKFNCDGYCSFGIMADSLGKDTTFLSANYLYDRYKMLTTKKVYAIIFDSYKSQSDPVRVNIDANTALLISRAVKKYIAKSN